MVNGKWFLRTETDYWLLVIMQSFLNVFPQGIPPLYFVLYSLLSTLNFFPPYYRLATSA